MKFLDLFAGVGGFSLGLERAGMTCVGHVEIEPFCQKVLKKHWPDVPLMADVREVQGDEFGAVDLICAGYPCQPFSGAGTLTGENHESYLWPEAFRVIENIRPRYVLLENVADHLRRGFDRVLQDLTGLGYCVEWSCVSACSLGASHSRRRLFVVAYPDDGREPLGRLDEEAPRLRQDARHMWHWGNPLPATVRMADGLPRRMDRLGALGNAVVPQVAQFIGEQILAAEASA